MRGLLHNNRLFNTTRLLVLPAFYFAIPSLMFLVVLRFLMNRFSLLMSLGGAYGIWIGAVLVVNRIVAGW